MARFEEKKIISEKKKFDSEKDAEIFIQNSLTKKLKSGYHQ